MTQPALSWIRSLIGVGNRMDLRNRGRWSGTLPAPAREWVRSCCTASVHMCVAQVQPPSLPIVGSAYQLIQSTMGL